MFRKERVIDLVERCGVERGTKSRRCSGENRSQNPWPRVKSPFRPFRRPKLPKPRPKPREDSRQQAMLATAAGSVVTFLRATVSAARAFEIPFLLCTL